MVTYLFFRIELRPLDRESIGGVRLLFLVRMMNVSVASTERCFCSGVEGATCKCSFNPCDIGVFKVLVVPRIALSFGCRVSS